AAGRTALAVDAWSAHPSLCLRHCLPEPRRLAMTTATLVKPERQATGQFVDWLRAHGVAYEIAEAGPSTAWSTDLEPPVSQTITVIDDETNPHLLVLDAGACLDLGVAAQALNRRWLTILAGSDRRQR